MPGVVLGHNARIAWGATNIDPDVQDLVIETVDPADPSAYLHDGASVPFTVRHEQIKVERRRPRSTSRSARRVHGPILNGVDDRLADAPPMAIRWTANVEADRTFEAILGLDTAATFDDFRAALSLYGAPAQNFVYADVDGHIGYQFPGYVPIRSDKADRGDRPVRATTAAASGPVACRSTTCPGSSTRGRRSWSPPTTPRWTATTRISSPRNGIRAIAPSASWTSSRRPGRMA